MTKKSKDLDEGLAAEKRPAGLASGVALLESGAVPGRPTPAGALQVAVELLGPEPEPREQRSFEAEELLLALEKRCMDGGTANLDDVRAVLAKLRGTDT